VKRLYAGLVAFVALGVLAWTTISDPRIRLATLAILVMFAVKTWVRRKDLMHPGKGSDVEHKEPM
jgi:hypothetical protein